MVVSWHGCATFNVNCLWNGLQLAMGREPDNGLLMGQPAGPILNGLPLVPSVVSHHHRYPFKLPKL